MKHHDQIKERLLAGDFDGAKALHDARLRQITRNERIMIAIVIGAGLTAILAPIIVVCIGS